MNWGFELLIRGANISEHVNRFGKSKPYELENMQHLVVDFRDKVPNRAYPENYVAVVFNAAFQDSKSIILGLKEDDFEIEVVNKIMHSIILPLPIHR